MKKAICLLSAAVISTGSINFTFAENTTTSTFEANEALLSTADKDINLDPGVDLFASIDGVTFELDPSQSLDSLTRVVKVKYDKTYFTDGINDFKVQICVPSSNVSGISYTTRLSGGSMNDSYENEVYTCSGSFSYNKIPSDGCLFTMTINLKERSLKGFGISLTGDTYLGDSTGMVQRLSNGGINAASLDIPGHSTEITGSGTDGAVTWTFDGVNKLTLHGNGTMKNYEKGTAPWYEYANKITEVVFEEDKLNNIGEYALYGLNKVKSITLSNDIYTINKGAFENCSALTDFKFNSNSGVGIGEDSFKNCSSLASITIPNNVTSIGTGAFEGCSSLNSITMPFIGLQRIKGSSDNFKVIFNGNVPSSLRSVTITDDTIIPDSAFEGCSYITEIKLNDTISSIGNNAFKGCSNLKEFIIPSGVSEIKNYTFQNCRSLYAMDIPDKITAIGEGAFDGCSGLRSVHIPAEITEIRDYTFRSCGSLKEIEIPTAVTAIGVSVLEGCNGLIDISVPFVGARIGDSTGVFGYLFGTTDNSKVPTSVTKVEITSKDRAGYIPKNAFKDCGNIEDIIIKGGRSILDSAFENCKMLKHLYLPSSIQNISYGTDGNSPILKGCTRIDTLTIPFVGTNKLDKETPTAVVGSLFGYDDTNIGEGTMQYYNSNGGFHYYKVPKVLKTVNILNQTTIPTGAFMGCDFLENVAVVTGAEMRNYAFYSCVSLKNAVLPNDLSTIGYQAFAECESLEKINIPNRVKSIGSNAFYNCRALVDVTMPDSITTIAKDVFNGTNLYGEDIQLMAAGGKITCSSGSEAHKFALEKGIPVNLVSSDELDKKTVGATIAKLSTEEYLLEIVDTNKLTGTIYAAVYDNAGKLILLKKETATEDGIEYQLSFTADEFKNMSYVKVFVWGGKGGMTPQTTESAVITKADIS